MFRQIRMLEAGLLAATLLILGLEAFCIFGPIVRRVRDDGRRLIKSRERLVELAHYDPLTGLVPTGPCSACASRWRSARHAATARWSRCCSWTSTTSRPSTTPSGTRPVTSSCARSGAGCRTSARPDTAGPGRGRRVRDHPDRGRTHARSGRRRRRARSSRRSVGRSPTTSRSCTRARASASRSTRPTPNTRVSCSRMPIWRSTGQSVQPQHICLTSSPDMTRADGAAGQGRAGSAAGARRGRVRGSTISPSCACPMAPPRSGRGPAALATPRSRAARPGVVSPRSPRRRG